MTNSFIIIVGCSKRKKNYSCKAKEMYSESPLFRKTITYIEKNYECGYSIISAKYGIISANQIIDPYDSFINNDISELLIENIKNSIFPFKKVIAFCGSKYVKLIRKTCPEVCIVEPLKGMGIGKRLKFLDEVNCQ